MPEPDRAYLRAPALSRSQQFRGSGSRLVDQLQQPVRRQLDLLVAPLGSSVVAGDDPRPVDTPEVPTKRRGGQESGLRPWSPSSCWFLGPTARALPEPDQVDDGSCPQRPFDEAEAKAMTDAGISSVRVWFWRAHVEAQARRVRLGARVDEAVAAKRRRRHEHASVPVRHTGMGGRRRRAGRRGSPTASRSPPAPRRPAPRLPTSPPRRCVATDPTAISGISIAGCRSGRSRIWQIWNEPNLVSFYRPAVDPIAYASVLPGGRRTRSAARTRMPRSCSPG